MSFTCLKYSALAFALCSIPAIAVAQPDAKTEARAHFDRGLALANAQAYAEAVAEFNRAYEISPHYAVLFNLGQAYVGMGQSVYAVEALSRYLTEGGAEVPPARRKQVEADISQQERRIATVTIRTPLPGAVVWVDGVEVGKSPMPAPLRLIAGAHDLAASLSGYRPWTQRLQVSGKEQRVVEIGWEPLGTPAAAAPIPPAATTAAGPAPVVPSPVVQPAPTPANPQVTAAVAVEPAPTPATDATAGAVSSASPAGPGPHRVAAYVVGGLGLGSLVVGGMFGFRAISKENDSDKSCPKDQCSQRGLDLNNEAKTSALVADLAIGAGLVGVAVATYLFLRSPRTADATQGATASGIHVAPEVGPGLAGLAVGGSW